MDQERAVYKPEYEDLYSRTEGLFIGTFVKFILLIFGSIIFFANDLMWFGVFYIVIFIFLMVYSFVPYVIHLTGITIDFENRTIEYQLFKYNKEYLKCKTEINNDIDVQLRYRWFRRYPKYEIKIFKKGKCIVKQIETKCWTREIFENIKKEINTTKRK